MRYLAVEPSGRIVHDAVRRRGGVRRGSRISHVTADADAAASSAASSATSAAAAATAVSAADPNDIVIAPVHPAARQTSSVASFARDPPRRFSRAAPSRTSAHPRSNEHPSCHGHLRDSHESRGITRGAVPDDDRSLSQD